MRTFLVIIVLLLVLPLFTEIQVEQGDIQYRIYERGTPRTRYFAVEAGRVDIGNSYTTVDLYISGDATVGDDFTITGDLGVATITCTTGTFSGTVTAERQRQSMKQAMFPLWMLTIFGRGWLLI